MLAASRYKSQIALPFFEIALEENPEREEFWLSYIRALISVDQIESAGRSIKAAKECGFLSGKFDALENQLLSPSYRCALRA